MTTAAESAFDTILRGGFVVDGTGTEPVRADVGIRGDRIAAVGDLSAKTAAREVDARGLYVLPGFIDAHSHADAFLADPRVQSAYLRQGVTTLVLGQDGLGLAPSDPASARFTARYFAAVNGRPPSGFESGGTIASLLASYDAAGPLNAAVLVPAASVRAEVIGLEPREPTAAELERMLAMVGAAMDDGAVGLSTGLDYVPGAFATTEELTALCAPVSESGGVYVSHLRGYSADRLEGSLRELAAIGSGAALGVHVSHLHGRAALVAPILDQIAAAGETDLSFDSYAYLRGSTILSMLILPVSVQEGGVDATLRRLGDPAIRRWLRTEVIPHHPRLSSITLSYLSAPDFAWAEGLSLRTAADRASRDLTDFICDALIACDLAIGCVVDNGSDRTDEDVRALLVRPEQLASSDAIYLGSKPHPRGWGAFSRLLGRHVRELGDWTWGAAAWHMSGKAAGRFGLGDRGRIADGAVADLVVLDPDTVTDRATYEDPTRQATGVHHVLVAGSFVMDTGTLTGAAAGRGIRRIP